MKLTNVVDQFFFENQWESVETEILRDTIRSVSSWYTVNTDVGTIDVKCFFDVDEQEQLFKLIMYVPDLQISEDDLLSLSSAIEFCNNINQSLSVGQFAIMSEPRILRFCASIDVTKASFECQHIRNMLVDGTIELKRYLPEFAATIGALKAE